MSGRSRTSFTKRQKEQLRQQKQREKNERRTQRKADKLPGTGPEMGENPSFMELGDDLDDLLDDSSAGDA